MAVFHDGDSMRALFCEPDREDVCRFPAMVDGGPDIVLRSLRRDMQHIEPQTGLLVWPGAELMCHYLRANPGAVRGRTVVELGSGAGLVAVAAALCGAACVLATDADIDALGMLAENAATNEVASRVLVEQLTWGFPHVGRLEEALKRVVDVGGLPSVLLGADITYQLDCVPDLFWTVEWLLARCAPECTLLLSYMPRSGVPIDRVFAAAQRAGLAVESVPLSSFVDASAYPAVAALLCIRRVQT